MRIRLLVTGILSSAFLSLSAQQVLSLDSCRQLAMHNNKQLRVAQLKQEAAKNTRKAVFTNYLPKIDALGGYEFTSRELSLLTGDQKFLLNNMGTLVGMMLPMTTTTTQALNVAGQRVTKAFETDTRNMFMGSVVMRQPLFMGGGIIAANKLAELNEQLAAESLDGQRQATLYEVDRAYWTVVSLRQKKQLVDPKLIRNDRRQIRRQHIHDPRHMNPVNLQGLIFHAFAEDFACDIFILIRNSILRLFSFFRKNTSLRL